MTNLSDTDAGGGRDLLDRGALEPEFVEFYIAFETRPTARGFGRLLTILSRLHELIRDNDDPAREQSDENEVLQIERVETGNSLTLIVVALAALKLATWLQDKWKKQEEIRKLRAEVDDLRASTEQRRADAERMREDLPRVRTGVEEARARIEVLQADAELKRAQTEQVGFDTSLRRAQDDLNRALDEEARVEEGAQEIQRESEELDRSRQTKEQLLIETEATEPALTLQFADSQIEADALTNEGARILAEEKAAYITINDVRVEPWSTN